MLNSPSNSSKLQWLSCLFCLLFGLAFIVNIHPDGDGLWFWYATAFRNGQHIYSDTHLPLQPLFILLTAGNQKLFGNGWLASKILAVAQLLVYIDLIRRIAKKTAWTDWQKSLLISGAFLLTLTSSYFRLDDYHITVYCLEFLCVLLLLSLRRVGSTRLLLRSALIGILCGLATSDRINDGGALIVACALCLFVLAPCKKLLNLVVMLLCSTGAMAGVIALTGDSFHAWFTDSLVRAAAIKGGSSNVLTSVTHFPYTMGKWFVLDPRLYGSFLVFVAVVLAALWAKREIEPAQGSVTARRPRLVLPIFTLAALAVLLFVLSLHEKPVPSVGYIGVPCVYLLSALILWRLLRHWKGRETPAWNSLEILISLPMLQLVAGSFTSGKSVLETYPPIALFLLLLPIVYANFFSDWRHRTVLVAFCAAVTFAGAITKAWRPYHWHHFQDRAFFTNRTWYDHPLYGPMYVDRDQLALMLSSCAPIQKAPAGELLSMPYPYANYFCGIPPWRGYVQTWYDTSSKQQIDALRDELIASPPKWIVYQRGLDTMYLHELTFLGNRLLPQRYLDQLIMIRLESHQWKLVRSEHFVGADWMLIQTRP